jgi:hypothetical protein
LIESRSDSSNKLLDAWPDVRHGDNCFHVFAKNNYAREIKHYSDASEDNSAFTRLCLEANNDGNTPAMEAAMRCNKEALLALLQPFLVFPNSDDLERLLHHENKEGQRLLAYVANHNKVLSVAHGIIIEMEALAHDHNSYKVKECLRTTLGSNASAALSKELFKNIRHKPTETVNKVEVFARVLIVTFLIRTAALFMDMLTDILLLSDYYDQWETQSEATKDLVLFPGKLGAPDDECLTVQHEETESGTVFFHGQSKENVTLGCYPGAIKGRERFFITLILILLPTSLYFFELLRFRIFSKFLEKFINPESPSFLYMWIVRPVVNFFTWLLWPLVSFMRQFIYTFRYETTRNEEGVGRLKLEARKTAMISSRAQLIEVCTEASLQPIFQFYLIFQDLTHLDLSFVFQEGISFFFLSLFSSGKVELPEAFGEFHRLQVFSVVISLLTLTWSYTVQYRQNKENSMGFFTSAYYFTFVGLLIVSRILCFEIFAYSLGPGNFGFAMIAPACHVLLMSLLHIVFSDSLAQCRRFSGQTLLGQLRQILLVTHNSLLNGLANLYMHNNLEIFIQNIRNAIHQFFNAAF